MLVTHRWQQVEAGILTPEVAQGVVELHNKMRRLAGKSATNTTPVANMQEIVSV